MTSAYRRIAVPKWDIEQTIALCFLDFIVGVLAFLFAFALSKSLIVGCISAFVGVCMLDYLMSLPNALGAKDKKFLSRLERFFACFSRVQTLALRDITTTKHEMVS